MRKEALVVFTTILSFLLITSAAASWQLLDSSNNAITDDSYTNDKKLTLILENEDTPYFLYRFMKENDNPLKKLLKLCGPCEANQAYSKVIHFPSKEEKYTLEVFDGIDTPETLAFNFDNKKPIVNELLPKSKYTNGSFSITVKEKNLDKDKVLFATGDPFAIAMPMDCPEEIENYKYLCTLNFPGEEGKTYYYHYQVIDKAGNIAETITKEVLFDSVAPKINIISPTEPEIPQKFVLSIGTSEKATIAISIDNQEINSRKGYTKLCNGCTSTSKLLTLSPGDHIIKVKATDKTGNEANSQIPFRTN